MLVTDVGDSLVILVANIHRLFTQGSGINIQKMPPTSNFSHQHHDVTSWCDFVQKRQSYVRIDLHCFLKSGYFRVWSDIEVSVELLSFVRQHFLSELTFKMSWKDIQSSLKERCWPFWNLKGSKLSRGHQKCSKSARTNLSRLHYEL